MAHLIEVGGGPVNPTEQWIVQRLLQELPDSYFVLPNLSLAEDRGGHVYEYDVVVVTPHAVHVVEIKAWRGTLTALSRQDWQLESGLVRRNPLLLTDLKARVLSTVLKALSLRDGSKTLPSPYVQACFVAGSDETTFQVFPDEQPRCLRPKDLAAYLKDPARVARRTDANAYARHTTQITQFLAGQLKGRAAAPRRFGSFLQLETLSQDEDSGTYLARHAFLEDGRIYRVRTWRVSPYKHSPPEREARLLLLRRAAEALARAGDHPNLLTLREFGENDDLFYEVTDWSERGTLASALARGTAQRWSVQKKLTFLAGVARGLASVAAQDVYHRNLSPHALLLGEKDTPRLTGFDRAFILTSKNTVFGSTTDLEQLAYLAPELQDIDGYDVFENTDLYSLGMIALELLSAPGGSQSPSGWQAKFSEGSSEVPALTAGLQALSPPQQQSVYTLLRGMLQPSPAQRIGSAQEVFDTIKQILAPPEVNPTAPSEAEPAAPELHPTASPTAPHAGHPHAQGLFLEGERIDQRYTVEKLLGEGAHGRVYAVQYQPGKPPLALKIFPPRDGYSPPDPMQALLQLSGRSHPHLVQTVGAGTHLIPETGQSLPYVVMRLLEAEPLPARLLHTPCTQREALTWAQQLLSALRTLHTHGPDGDVLVHRDLRPANLMCAQQGIVLIDLDSIVPLSMAGNAPHGALRYSPPDLAECGWSPEADRFSVGVMLYEWLSGHYPWPGGIPLATLATPLRQYCPELPPSLTDAIDGTIASHQKTRSPFSERLEAEIIGALAPASPKVQEDSLQAHAPVTSPIQAPHATEPLQPLHPPLPSIALWNPALVEALISASHPALPLYDVLRQIYHEPLPDAPVPLERAFLQAEAGAEQLERPLPLALGTLYDALLEPLAPVQSEVPEASLDIAASALKDPMLALEYFHLAELPGLLKFISEHGWQVEERVWVKGSVRPPLQPWAQTLTLPVGRLDQHSLPALLLERRALLQTAVETFLARAGNNPCHIVVVSGSVFLGHGLGWQIRPGDFGDPSNASWTQRFGMARSARSQGSSPPSGTPFIRSHAGTLQAVGRLFWPRTADAQRLDHGGLSLNECLLPWLVLSAPVGR